MPEEKDKPQNQNGEPSLEEQLQALLRGISDKTAEEKKPVKKQPPQENSQDEQVKPPSQITETPSVPPKETPSLPKAAEIKAESPAPPSPTSGPAYKETTPKTEGDSNKKSPLTEELAALFGATSPAPGVFRPSSAPPPTPAPVNPVTGPVTGRQPTSEPVLPPPTPSRPETRPNLAPEPETPVITPILEAVFKDEVIEGTKPGRPLLGLSFLQNHVISLSIDGTSLRILTLAGNSIETWTSVPIEPQFLREGYIPNIVGMGQAIAKAMRLHNISPGKVICSFTSLGSISRILSLPQSAKKDLANIVPRELRRASINTDNYFLNWRVIPIMQGPMQVFIVGVPKEPLVAMLEALRIANLKPVTMELKPLALARAINKKDAIIAHGERDSLELALIVEGIPSLMRSIYLGIETTPDQVIARLVEELERTIYFYNGAHREQPLDPQIPIYITGEIANFQNLINSQIPALGRNIAPLETPLKLPNGFPTATFMVNIGLLLKKI